jgi:microcystin-dependent protein
MALIAGVQYSGTPAGTIVPCGTSGALPRTLLCDGSAISRPISNGGTVDTYKALFDAIGTAYGVGDGSTTFNLPDTRNVFLRGVNASTRTIGSISYPAVTRGTTTNDRMQGHRHSFAANLVGNGSGIPNNSGAGVWGSYSGTTDSITDTVNGTPRVGSETAPVNLGVNYCIAF